MEQELILYNSADGKSSVSLLALLERADADNAEAVSDLSEDMRQELDNIYQAIAALSIKVPQARKPSQPIGFKPTTKK